MAMEYYIDVDCDMKKRAGGMEALLDCNKYRFVVKTMVELVGRQHPELDIMSEKTVREIRTPEGTIKKKEATVGQLKKESDWMYKWTEVCGRCKYAFIVDEKTKKKSLVGCYGAIPYPVSELAERIVGAALDTVCQLPSDQPPRMIVDYILAKNVTGEQVAKMRTRGLFERSKPLIGKVGIFKKVTTDQVFELLFFYEQSPRSLKDMISPFMSVVLGIYVTLPPELGPMVRSDNCVFNLVGLAQAFQKAAKMGLKVETSP